MKNAYSRVLVVLFDFSSRRKRIELYKWTLL